MPVPYEVEDAPVDAYLGADLRVAEMPPFAVPLGSIEAEATDVSLGLAVLQGNQLVAERHLLLEVRLRIDDIVHLWHDRHDAISAAVTIDPAQMRLSISLTFNPVGISAARASEAAEFLRIASIDGAQFALRLPDGTLGPERIPVSPNLKVDEKLVRLLRLIADVGRLANVDVPVPSETNAELIRALLTAQQLLSGQPVRRRWDTAEIKLDSATLEPLKEALEKSSRHEFLQVAEMFLKIGDVVIPLGEIQQQFSDAIVKDVAVEDRGVVLRLRAHGNSSPVEMRPANLAPPPIEARLAIPEAAFNELLDDLDTPARPSKLRELM
ncbi:hypothetical protein [Kribbella lupini]|uniref:Uncharacterized protein n=1 Tax=Kribbella lupini TaxID=291602 RepID=A0ABN2B778_9ACTN